MKPYRIGNLVTLERSASEPFIRTYHFAAYNKYRIVELSNDKSQAVVFKDLTWAIIVDRLETWDGIKAVRILTWCGPLWVDPYCITSSR